MSHRKMLMQRVLPAVVSLAALAWLLRSIEISAVVAALDARVLIVLVPALLVYGAVTLALEAGSITLLMSHRQQGFGMWTVARIKCASYLLGIVNYTLGAGALTILLRRRAGLGLGECASIVLLITSVDLLLLMLMAAAGTTLMDTAAPGVRAGVFALLVVGFVAGMTVLRLPGNLGPIERLRSLTVFEALRTTPLPRLAKLACMRVFFTSSFIALGGAAFVGFGIPIPMSDLIVGMVVVGVVSALPIAVAGLGTGQIAVVEVFGHLAPEATLLALSLVLAAGLLTLRAGMGLLMAREFTREALEESRAAEA
ncbi:MAG: lysylphosphatidylglycerol synthase domain-containing protein [Myxococcota bacterium]